MQKTGDIRQFVIIEEGGIAKGIRRMVAVTGPEAAAATAAMDAAEKQLEEAKAMKDPKQKEAAIKALTRVCPLGHHEHYLCTDIDALPGY